MDMLKHELEHISIRLYSLHDLLTRIYDLAVRSEEIPLELVGHHRAYINDDMSRIEKILAQLAQKYEVQQYSLCEGWANNWSIEEDGISKPVVFDTEEQAQQALNEFFQEMAEEIASGDSGYHREEFRIRPVAQD